MVPAPGALQYGGMDDTTTSTRPDRLRRDPAGGVWAGVAAGLARRYGIETWIVRVGFIFLSLFGGLGLLLYIAGWVLIPADGEEQALVERWIRDGERTNWVGVVLIGIAAVILLSSVRFLEGDVVFAVALLVVGVLLYQGTFDDRPARARLADRLRPEEEKEEGVGDTSGAPGDDEPEPDAEVAAGDEDRALLDAAFGVDSHGGDHTPEQGAGQGWSPPPRPPSPRSILGRLILAALLIVIGGLAIGSNLSSASLEADEYVAAALLIVGAGLLIGAWWGRARSFIILGLFLIPLLQAAVWFDVPLQGGFGDPLYRPTDATQLSDAYRLTGGELVLDLTDVRFGEDVDVQASVAFGQLIVRVPDDVNVDYTAEVIAGEARVFGRVENGAALDIDGTLTNTENAPTVSLDLEVGFGELVVVDVETGRGG